MRVEDVGLVAAGAGMTITPLLRVVGICVDMDDRVVMGAILNVCDGDGGLLGEGNPMTME